MFSKFVLLFSIVACAHSSPAWMIRNGLAPQVLSTGISTGTNIQDGAGNYAFNYGIANEVGATNARAESGDAAGNRIGSYSLTDTDGRARRVDYVADSLGFRASVNTNEPGTAMSAPADASVISPYAMPVAPTPIAAAAPVGSVAAPVVAAASPVSAYSTVIESNTGASRGERVQDNVGNYAFNYGITDGIGATNARAESGDVAGNKIGSYSLTDIDGRARRVDYVADGLGFRASVRTNEPGTALSAPADTNVISQYAMPVAPAPVAAAPALAAAPIAALPALAAAPVAYSTAITHAGAIPLGLRFY